ncbi:hypothetical protein FFM54_22730 [Burkholderia pseudomallei]|nr:hypothetical protein [Burkholderia pseudomallei]MWA30289.1 hypothetical protein [Burkholderia pseudomallei]NRE31907.1 hypothetical protein [Burkholderia pseudomallei]QBI51269.1 hypothetical protein EXY72_34650 [Burkholderia pseudomallei]QCU27837.1 hypothetical protein FE789_05875 [Burkholderia pseudomallei]
MINRARAGRAGRGRCTNRAARRMRGARRACGRRLRVRAPAGLAGLPYNQPFCGAAERSPFPPFASSIKKALRPSCRAQSCQP